ncbi:hypothetical protein SFC15_00520 [Shouchella clausii]
MEAEKKFRKPRPFWLKWLVCLVGAYIGLLVVVLAAAILSMSGTFLLVVLELFVENDRLQEFNYQYFVPMSEFLWNLFTALVPGL